MRRRGFTLIEILMVIAIMGILASVVLSNVNSARESAQQSKATSEIRQVRNAIALLADDTGKWPNGCAIGDTVTGSGNEIELTDTCSGITSTPPGSGCTCTWAAQEIAAWNGPYYEAPLDPWGNSYWFDSDYYPRRDCGEPGAEVTVAVVSNGPNGTGGASNGTYDCDDIYMEIR